MIVAALGETQELYFFAFAIARACDFILKIGTTGVIITVCIFSKRGGA